MLVATQLAILCVNPLQEYRGRGNTDGSFHDHRLFDCSPNCGCFVSMEKLILCESKREPVSHQPQRQASVKDDKPTLLPKGSHIAEIHTVSVRCYM